MKRLTKPILKWSIFLSILILTAVLLTDFWIRESAKDDLYDQIQDLPCQQVALVLGASKTVRSGRTNLFFAYRMDAAAALYHAGKVKHFLLSGDNHIDSYDEPSDMKEALLKRGIPESAITLDYAGFRTLDSIVRAKEVFGLQKILIISQRFHNERALFIARAHGVEATAFNAQSVSRRYALKTHIREYLARVKAVLDVYILGVDPKFLGEPIHITIQDPCEN